VWAMLPLSSARMQSLGPAFRIRT